MFIDTHYSGVNDPETFRSKMWNLYKALPKLRLENDIDCWFVSGKSGIVAMASLSMMGSKEPICSIRKPGENHHGSTFEGNPEARKLLKYRTEPLRMGIVDDFVSSGATAARMFSQLQDAMNVPVELPLIVGYGRVNRPVSSYMGIPIRHGEQEIRLEVMYVGTME